MKKYLLGLFAIALAIGFSAFTSKSPAPANGSAFTNYYWFEAANLTSSGYFGTTSSLQQEVNNANCQNAGSIPCEKAFLSTQLVGGVPTGGVISGSTPQFTINKP